MSAGSTSARPAARSTRHRMRVTAGRRSSTTCRRCCRSRFRHFGADEMVQVALPQHLRTLAGVSGEIEVDAGGAPTLGSVLDAVEARFPVLRGTIREHGTLKRRPFIRFFACKEDLSLEPAETRLPDEVINGSEPFMIIGAIAGG